MMKPAIVITLHNYFDLFGIPCIESVREWAPKNSVIMVFDNESKTPFHEVYDVSKVHHYVRVEDQESNNGLTGTWNTGIALAIADRCSHVCLLNHDTVVDATFPALFDYASGKRSIYGPVSDNPGNGGREQRGHADIQYRKFMTGSKSVKMLNGFCMNARTECWVESGYDPKNNLFFHPKLPFAGNENEMFIRHKERGGDLRVIRAAFVKHSKNNGWKDPVYTEDGGVLRPKCNVSPPKGVR